MTSWQALIVDDERLARQDLRNLLADHEEVEILGEASDGNDALAKVKELSPNLIFLDIQMPGMSGFDLLEKLDSQIKVIFVTAFDEYAIRAFEVNALDYLLKPISHKRLADSMGRLEQDGPDLEEDTQRPLSHRDRLLIRLDNYLRFLKIDDITCIESAGDYSEVNTVQGTKHLVYKPMNEWERRLPEDTFCRIHRSTIVNLDALDRLEDWFNHSYRVYIRGIEKPFVMSRRYAARLKKKMS